MMGEASLETSPKNNMIQDTINSDNMKTFSSGCFKNTWQGLKLTVFCTSRDPRLRFFSVSGRVWENQNH